MTRSVDQKRKSLLEDLALLRRKEQELMAQELAWALSHHEGFHIAQKPTCSSLHIEPNSPNHPVPNFESAIYFSREGRAVLEQLYSMPRHSGSGEADD